MRRTLCVLCAVALCALPLSACSLRGGSRDAEPTAEAVFEPETTAIPESRHGEEDQSKVIGDLPTLPPAETIGPDANTETDDPQMPASEDEAEYFSIDALLSSTDGPDVDFPDAGDTPASPASDPAATEAPASNDIAIIDPATYQFSALTDTALGFTFNYPSHWVSVPGVYTVCFREPQEEGKFPARVAITVKKMVHTPDEQVLAEQLTSYMRIIHNQYDKSTFESGTPNLSDNLMGRLAMSNTYLAYSGKNEVKGYVIGTAVGRNICVFHFCAAYEDYAPLEGAMQYMLHSIQAVESTGN